MICLVLTIFATFFQAACTGVHERTFLAVKPDGVQRRLVGEIVRRFERKGFKLVALKLVQSARREIALWFSTDELLCWEDSAGHWLYE
ncbi:nucleoside diphosphate kinase 3 [Carlito syrichta]|uniref:nucleoside-diphosphate kinase n=1 Tax=Carlito syrichta TaxID=1868482 RepID=A0A1U7URP0_CARSF|nr:nucleoside diphosphate kinase 3 [Carlito syrichta]